MLLRQSSRKAIFCLSARLDRASFLVIAMGEPFRIESSDEEEEESSDMVCLLLRYVSSSVLHRL